MITDINILYRELVKYNRLCYIRLFPHTYLHINMYDDTASTIGTIIISTEVYIELNNNITKGRFNLSDIDNIIKRKIINRRKKLNKI